MGGKGSGGHNRKPTAQKLAEGNRGKRRLNLREPKALPGEPQMPSGMTGGIAGQGVQASLLGTAKGPSGDLYLTYGGWPLYTYSRDPGPARAAGQGISSFGGTWSVVSPAGAPITGAPSSPASTAGGGYRYP